MNANNTANNSNTTYNLIILDRSGSMEDIRRQAVTGLNETVGTVKAYAKSHPQSEQLVSIVAFCSCGRTYLADLEKASQVKPLTMADYEPCCCTPLYDAIGEACTQLHNIVKGDKSAAVSVTIITDGYENASKEWTHTSVQRLIKLYKSEGWLFAYIGADHDVEKVASQLNIDNTLTFDKSEEGTRRMFARERRSRTRWLNRVDEVRDICDCPSGAVMNDECNAGYFDEAE